MVTVTHLKTMSYFQLNDSRKNESLKALLLKDGIVENYCRNHFKP